MKRTRISLTAEDRRLLDADLRAIDSATGAWAGHDIDAAKRVAGLRSGDRMRETITRLAEPH